jgi:hypothetical protein
MNAYGFEIHPSPNAEYISALAANDMLVYSCGSLWTRYAFPFFDNATETRMYQLNTMSRTARSRSGNCALAFVASKGPST